MKRTKWLSLLLAFIMLVSAVGIWPVSASAGVTDTGRPIIFEVYAPDSNGQWGRIDTSGWDVNISSTYAAPGEWVSVSAIPDNDFTIIIN